MANLLIDHGQWIVMMDNDGKLLIFDALCWLMANDICEIRD